MRIAVCFLYTAIKAYVAIEIPDGMRSAISTRFGMAIGSTIPPNKLSERNKKM